MGMKEYEAKRKFEQTPEPRPALGPEGNRLIFIIHKHAARNLHYDIRLEMQGVLKCWACPKGPSLDPGVKRLAVMVEDHPLDYKDFEGVIPAGNYGAGGVIIWDRGFYHHPAAKDGEENEKLLLAGLRKGDLKFVLEGEKLRGEFALVKTRWDEKSWLLLKKKDRYTSKGEVLQENRSVASHRTLEELLASGSGQIFEQQKIAQIRAREAMESEMMRKTPVEPMPLAIQPMLATLAREPFDHPDWIFEVKWDGYRAIAQIRDGKVALSSRNQLSLNKKYPPIVDALSQCRFDAVLDGEIVVVDDQGQPSFQMLQDYQESGGCHLLYYVFDLLYFQGHNLTQLPLLSRKEFLKTILPPGSKIRFSDHVEQEGLLYFQVVKGKGLEGIVAKHAQSPYQMGKRSRQWLKVKTQQTQEAVIAGFTEPRGRRKHFGALVLGVFHGNELVYIGHSGGGFTTKVLQGIHQKLEPLIQNQCPFPMEPKTNTPATWVKPELVCEVAFTGWTDDAVMRHPVFLRMREDKAASEVVINT
jgi:bifunctional non-homologous end joining protein LigD